MEQDSAVDRRLGSGCAMRVAYFSRSRSSDKGWPGARLVGGLKVSRESVQINVLTGAIVVPLVVALLWLLWPYHPIIESGSPVVLTPVVKAGEELHLRRAFCIHVDAPSISSRHLVNSAGQRISLPVTQHYTPPGCTTKEYLVEVPEWAPPGHYTYDVTLTYSVNPLRDVSTRLASAMFEVVK